MGYACRGCGAHKNPVRGECPECGVSAVEAEIGAERKPLGTRRRVSIATPDERTAIEARREEIKGKTLEGLAAEWLRRGQGGRV